MDLIERQAAIEAIFSEPIYKSGMKKRYADAVVPAIYEKIKSLPSAQPDVPDTNVGDMINRRAAIKAIEDLQDCYNGFSDTYDKACIIGALEEVPSAQPERCEDCRNFNKTRLVIPQPERKRGKWLIEYLDGIPGHRAKIIYCSECCKVNMFRTAFCPHCGAEMREENDNGRLD